MTMSLKRDWILIIICFVLCVNVMDHLKALSQTWSKENKRKGEPFEFFNWEYVGMRFCSGNLSFTCVVTKKWENNHVR